MWRRIWPGSRHAEVPPRGESKSAAPLISGSFVEDHLLCLLFTKSAAAGHCPPAPPCRVPAFGALTRFLENLLNSYNLVCSATARMKTTLDINRLCFKYFAVYFLKALGIYTFPRTLWRKVPLQLVYSILSLFLCMWWSPQFANLSLTSQKNS